ncbi:PRC-barrel domain-containing protein [Bacillus sp. FJAT-47783]|uniref:PRC-barrel domain-containing protein n=1 Tax=Bacillus sp. FJAT-47783 TaxID=2922712 RepID=UPI001FABD5C6|nr:PRC-barrel domain-containing protein [Bacillus sp. FJAT-47783]
MRTFSDIKGIPVYLRSGKIVGYVEDIALSETGSIEGLIIEGKGFFGRDKLVKISSISSIGQDGIMLNGKETEMYETSNIGHRFYETKGSIRHKELLLSTGDKVGLVDDVYMTNDLDTIVAYEVTEGFFADVTVGTKTVHVENEQIIGKDVIVLQ